MRKPYLAILIVTLLAACGSSTSPLDGELTGGFVDTEESESHNRGTLYTYMDGGADLYLEYGFSSLWVRQYARGRERYLVELYEMKDPESAFAIYSYNRRPDTEAEIVRGCPGAITDAEIQLARGNYYLVCRNEDPMARDRVRLVELARQIADRLQGPCGPGDLFVRLPAERRIAGSEVALFGPIGLNVRPWLTSLGKDGFSRGWLARFNFPTGQVETLLAEYSRAADAERAVAKFRKSQAADVAVESREDLVVVTHAPGIPQADVNSLISALLSEPEWR